MRVLVADDHPIVRQGIRQLLIQEFADGVIDEAETAEQAMLLVRANHYSLLLLDLALPERGGLDCLAECQRLRPEMPVLVLSMFDESQFAVRAIKAGAAGYLNKQHAAAEILKAVHKVLAGGHYLSEVYAAQVAVSALRGESGVPHERLTEREFQVLCLIGSGKTVGEIALLLNRSVKTVSSHRVRILEKMNMRTNAELTHYCIKNQLVQFG